MGWSEHGANQMCKLRCYKANGGNIIQLVKEQQELKATGTEGKTETLKTILGNMTKKEIRMTIILIVYKRQYRDIVQ